jgi:hypothetical protein
MCHGKTGNGKGDVAADTSLRMNDETILGAQGSH